MTKKLTDAQLAQAVIQLNEAGIKTNNNRSKRFDRAINAVVEKIDFNRAETIRLSFYPDVGSSTFTRMLYLSGLKSLEKKHKEK